MMIQTDLRVLCYALGFIAVILKNSDAAEKYEHAQAALAIAELAEEFCLLNAHSQEKEESCNGNDFELHQHMAAAIVSTVKLTGQCNPHDLEAKGFTLEDIRQCWAMARALAHVMLHKTDT